MSSERIMNLLVTIPAESRRMNVGKDVIRILGSPAYICILQRKDRQSIAITPCAAEHPMSFKVPDRLLTDGQCRMRINGVQFVQALLEAKGRNGQYTKELWIDRRENSKSLAWSSVLLALNNIKEVGAVVDRPKALGDIRGVTYIYGMFYRFGLIDMPDKVNGKMKRAGRQM